MCVTAPHAGHCRSKIASMVMCCSRRILVDCSLNSKSHAVMESYRHREPATCVPPTSRPVPAASDDDDDDDDASEQTPTRSLEAFNYFVHQVTNVHPDRRAVPRDTFFRCRWRGRPTAHKRSDARTEQRQNRNVDKRDQAQRDVSNLAGITAQAQRAVIVLQSLYEPSKALHTAAVREDGASLPAQMRKVSDPALIDIEACFPGAGDGGDKDNDSNETLAISPNDDASEHAALTPEIS
ncbi:hypothetical protein G7046_g8402 [Stylonectria norvegica]|nr:hypothetical protein G7046_g8402 [Stylonectria norvegica]